MAGKMLTQVPEEPWATVCADFVGPLPRSKHGNQMLLVLIDRFSKWTELVPLWSATAESLKKAFRERIIARYGVPKIVITDNGVQFASKIFNSFLAEMGTKQQFTAPYTPQENPTESKWDGEDNDSAVRRAEPKKLEQKMAGNHAGNKHERFRIHRLHTVVHYPMQRTKTTERPIRQRPRRRRQTNSEKSSRL